MYKIYHIPEIKVIGCTNNLHRRIRNERKWRGDYEVLETHTCEHIAGERERELQRQYGYDVDRNSYAKVVAMPTFESRSKGGKIGGKVKCSTELHKQKCRENVSKANKLKRALTFEQAEDIRKMYATGNWTYRGLAIKYDIHPGAIQKILNGTTYKRPL